MWEHLREIGRELPGDTRVVVVRGEGRAFSAGLDLAAVSAETAGDGFSFANIAAMDDEAADALIAGFQAGFSWLRRPDLVTVAAVQGHAIGAGFQLALACDLRVLADDATFTMAESRYGLVPDLGGTHPLVAAVGYPRALEICLTARQVDAVEALAIGLATIVVPRASLDAAVADLVAALLSPPPDVVTETKAMLLGALHRDRDAQEAAERAAQLRRLRAVADRLAT
jgi:enoyl-CoA hydratase/carnithine racemase